MDYICNYPRFIATRMTKSDVISEQLKASGERGVNNKHRNGLALNGYIMLIFESIKNRLNLVSRYQCKTIPRERF